MKPPKEKALELIEKFIQFTPAEEDLERPHAMQCAIIHCKEVIKALNRTCKYLSEHLNQPEILDDVKYYENVLKNLESND